LWAEASDGQEAFAKMADKTQHCYFGSLSGEIDGVGLIREAKKQLVKASRIRYACIFQQPKFIEECCEAGAAYCMLNRLISLRWQNVL
jgi:hypothetical protein